ncbi:GHMP family kinase ATP-binding protein [Aminipila luticellarii]|uniref:GHMP kinase n=1 Tax=Aminipila luticellarii TaxID=2507160 RepID=A0A410PSH1_9FIRM|nr:GHMP kinase [Aminipila luticellarii]QAT41912.1 GHMP kinase [Aminipila luticellarii]
MIITRTPFRVSFAGGGSDLPSFYTRHEGCVLSTSINKYMYVTIHPSFNRMETSIKYSLTETVHDVRYIQHPIARQLLMNYDISGVEVTSTADIPAGTGLSSSSAYTVGLINALNAFSGKYYSQEKIARRACEVEIEELGEPIGKQDQYGTAIGGIKFIRFLTDGSVDVEPVMVDGNIKNQLNDELLLFYTGVTHSAGNILKEQNKNVVTDRKKFDCLVKMTEQAYEIREALTKGNLKRFGEILHEGWELKRQLAGGITSPEIDQYYKLARENGALGGKLLGAGGGGFLLLYCEHNKQKRLRSALHKLVELPFATESGGTKVIYVGEKDWE